eukprot:m.324110 g.324110  ORF g.324110 m.324110 type:complete len:65 (-) comp20368_c0_seq8:426-620(-)
MICCHTADAVGKLDELHVGHANPPPRTGRMDPSRTLIWNLHPALALSLVIHLQEQKSLMYYNRW